MLQTLRAGQDDAIVLEPPRPAEKGEFAIRLEPSSRVRLTTWTQSQTGWFLARDLRLSDGILWWLGRGGVSRSIRLGDVRRVDVNSFHRFVSLALMVFSVATFGGAIGFTESLAPPLDDESASTPDAAENAVPGPAPSELLFTEHALRTDVVRFVIAQDVGVSLSRVPDLFLSTRAGLRFRDFVEVSIGLRLLSLDVLSRGPLAAPVPYFIPGVSGRLLVIGALDPGHRVALVLGGEATFDPQASGRVLWGVEVQPAGQLHLTLLPLTPLFSARGVGWGLSLDTACHF
ncbi:MAG: hypothetical protein Q8N26_02305 [Myxococcales bacterium]|nr:hypothetical protein [Myxococcales bacterium]